MLSVKDLAYEDTKLGKESVNSLCGPCPNYARGKCNRGENGFVVKWDNSRGEWRFSCRGCWPADEYLPEKDRKRGFGDAIDYLRHFRDMFFPVAQALVNDGEPSVREVAPSKYADYTTAVWQKKTDAAVKAAVDLLQDDTRALEYARSRGFNDGTIDWARMGFSLHENIPRLIIPSINDRRYVAVYRRDLRPDVPKGKRWKDAFGGTKSELYLADCLVRKLVTVLVEAPICALTVLQEYGRDAINAVATGSTDGARGAKSLARLARMPLVLVAFDADVAGDEGAEYWLKRLPNARRLRPLLIDVNDMLVDGWDIQEWIDQAIEKYLPTEETPAPPPDQPQEPIDDLADELLEEQELEEPLPSSPSHDVHTRTPEEYWAMVHAKVLRPPVDGYNVPYYTREEWKRRYEESINKRPDPKLVAHYPDGYKGYCRIYQTKKGA